MNLLEKAMKKLTESKEIEVNEEDMLTDIDNTEVVKEDKINIEEIANKCLEQDTDYILEVIEDCGSKKEFVNIVSEDPSDFGFDFIIPDDIFDTPNERKIYGLIYDKLTKQEAEEIEVNENDMLEADIEDVEVVDEEPVKESKGTFLEVKMEDLIKEEVTPESDYYEYVKGLLDLGAIDDPEYVKTLSDEEYDKLIKHWMKDLEIKADYDAQQNDFEKDAMPLGEDSVEESIENHGNKTTELNDNDPALKKPYESETVKDIASNMKALKSEGLEEDKDHDDYIKKCLDASKEKLGRDLTDDEKEVAVAFAELLKADSDARKQEDKEILTETGEWDDNDDEMVSWKENLREQATELANQINGECKSVHGFDAYQGPFAIVNSPKHGDIQLWFDNEDDTGLSFIAKVAHVGWIGGGINDIANTLNQDTIPEDAVISECLHPEANFEEDVCPDCGKEECECKEEIVENINKPSFNVMLTKFVKENYKNAKNLRVDKISKVEEGYKIEATLKMKDEKITPVTFLAKGTITEGKTSILKIYENKVFRNLDENKNMMTMIVSNNGTIKLEKLRYNFNTMLSENKKANVYGIIK